MSSETFKILFVDLDVRSMNLTRTLYKNVLMHGFDVNIFGPGYVNSEVLNQGLHRYVDKHGPFDFVISNEQVVFSVLVDPNLLLKVYTNHGRRFSDSDLRQLPEIGRAFQEIDMEKCLFLLQTDVWNLRGEKLRILNELDCHIIGWGEQFVVPSGEMKDLDKESFFDAPNDNYLNIVTSNRDKIISVPAFVAENEFCFHPLHHRKWKWSVLGARYWARAEADKRLRQAKIDVSGFTPQNIIEILKRYRIIRNVSAVHYDLSNFLFRRTIMSSCYSYTCGSALRFPIRKFFEIPALGSVLVCQPCSGLRDLGFVDKESAVECRPEEILDVHQFLEDDLERAQSIASAGRDVIWRNHTTSSRARQLRKAFAAIKAGKFRGSYWADGEFHVVAEETQGRQQTRHPAA